MPVKTVVNPFTTRFTTLLQEEFCEKKPILESNSTMKTPTPLTRLSSRSQSADACIQGHEQPAAITRHHTVDDLWWVQAEESLTSGFFLMWAVCVVLLGGGHLGVWLSVISV